MSVCAQFSTDGSSLVFIYSSEQYSVNQASISHSPVSISISSLGMMVVAFPFDTVVFNKMACLLAVALPQISLFSFPLPFTCTSCFVAHFPVVLRSLRFQSFLSQFSPLVAQIKNISAVTQGFFFWRGLPRISLALRSLFYCLRVVRLMSPNQLPPTCQSAYMVRLFSYIQNIWLTSTCTTQHCSHERH